MTRAQRLRAYNHTFEARGYRLGDQPSRDKPSLGLVMPSDRISCPCGMWLHIISPIYATSALYICQRCGAWHTAVWHGPKGMEETIEDEEIRRLLWKEEHEARTRLTNAEKKDLHRRIDAIRQKAKHPDS